MWKIVSFASTKPNIYAECANRLARQCDNLGYEHKIELIEFDEHASRKDIVLYKPEFILKELSRSEQPLLWLDCDTALIRPFAAELPNDDWDVGFLPSLEKALTSRVRKVFKHGRLRHKGNDVAGFALAVRPTADALHFMEVWKYLCKWKGLAPGGDHKRMDWARQMTTHREINLASYVNASLIFNKGRAKEQRFSSPFYLRWLRIPR